MLDTQTYYPGKIVIAKVFTKTDAELTFNLGNGIFGVLSAKDISNKQKERTTSEFEIDEEVTMMVASIDKNGTIIFSIRKLNKITELQKAEADAAAAKKAEEKEISVTAKNQICKSPGEKEAAAKKRIAEKKAALKMQEELNAKRSWEKSMAELVRQGVDVAKFIAGIEKDGRSIREHIASGEVAILINRRPINANGGKFYLIGYNGNIPMIAVKKPSPYGIAEIDLHKDGAKTVILGDCQENTKIVMYGDILQCAFDSTNTKSESLVGTKGYRSPTLLEFYRAKVNAAPVEVLFNKSGQFTRE